MIYVSLLKCNNQLQTYFKGSIAYNFFVQSYLREAPQKSLTEIIYSVYTVLCVHRNIIENSAVNKQRKQPVKVFSFFLHVYFITYCISIYRLTFHNTLRLSFCAASLPVESCFFLCQWSCHYGRVISQHCFR